MDLSLDEIIKEKKILVRSSKFAEKKSFPIRKTANKPVFKDAQRIKDARYKIIQNNRAKIRDARDKLTEMTRASGIDVRQKLLQKHHLNRASSLRNNWSSSYRNGRVGGTVPATRRGIAGIKTKRNTFRDAGKTSLPHMPETIDVPRGYIDYDDMERLETEEYATLLSRTVKNDIAHYDMPPTPRHLNSWMNAGTSSKNHYDPFDMYEVPKDRRDQPMSTDILPPPPKGILRSNVHLQHKSDMFERRYIPDTASQLSYEMRSRLERAPDPHASMGIFSNPLKPSSSVPQIPQSGGGYRIVVSNLHTSVNQSDIRELFEDIGELYESRIVRPGVAEVIYKSLADAENAVDTYHNRQLDGQPMKCLLVKPRASNKPTAPAIKASNSNLKYTSGKASLEVDIDTLHKVLFQRK